MTHVLGILIEGSVAALLMVTIGYCVVLNRRLKGLKTDERVLRDIIRELVVATDKAERSIAGLKLTVQESDSTLGEHLRAAELLTATLAQQLGSGEVLVSSAAYSTAPPDPKAMVAAATAFAERARSRLGRAA